MAYDYVFGFGSIINTDTHAPWVSGVLSGSKALQGQRAFIRSSLGYRRGWNFRSNTGFTALGVTKDESEATDINGVLFQIPHSMFEGFDRREVGYDRVELSREDFELIPLKEGQEGNNKNGAVLDIQPNERVWFYVPQPSYCAEANENHPILQSYVDTVMQGCLEWGGEDMASSFVATTSSWSSFFLNDTPSSRRPWLFRKEYNTIDRILSINPSTHYADRRHPEEFASAFLIKMMRGEWSVPRRNNVFTGRDEELDQIHSRLTIERTDQHRQSSIETLEVAGMGGVGKTQICTEYCYRYYPSYYGLVIWLSAHSAECVAASYRQLMSDTTGMDVQDKDTDEVVAEVKARLYRSKVPWLLVFDNLEDRSLLEKFVPHGGSTGHVLVTTRLVDTDLGDQTMILGCFNPSESVELLCRSASISGEAHISAANELANQLGHLPLALNMAGSYMQRCDVDCSEYVARYVESESSGVILGHKAVASSLNMSLNAIKKENPTAWEALRLLAWLGPDQITKALVRSLLRAKEARLKAEAEPEAQVKATLANSKVMRTTTNALVGSLALFSLVMFRRRQVDNVNIAVNVFAAASLSAATALYIGPKRWQVATSVENREVENTANTPNNSQATKFSANEFEQTDLIWKILKSFSILVVKDSKGTMHRLLAQALRTSQNEKDSRRNLEICVRAVQCAWTFKPEQVDSWQNSGSILEHVKAIVLHASEQSGAATLDIAILSREAGVFSAMALNRFEEAQFSLEQSLEILDGTNQASMEHMQARVAALHELGRVFRYQGNFRKSENALQEALEVQNKLATTDLTARQGVAATLHELGILEIRKHNLDSAASFLQKALELRYSFGADSPLENIDIEAQCAATLHQLAAVQLARKPPLLDKAWGMLQEALGLNMQIGQRAATLKQLARVAIRRGEFDSAEKSLGQALELYVELYGESTLHINVAAVKFQQGALAFQREQLENAWIHYSECLRARQHVYAYLQGNHLEVSSTLHELGRVAYSQNRSEKAIEMLHAEKEILDQLCETSTQRQSMLQARLTNLTWLRKCAKESGDDKEARKITMERTSLKTTEKNPDMEIQTNLQPHALRLQQEVVRCRLLARQFALACPKSEDSNGTQLRVALASVYREIDKSPPCSMKGAASDFQKVISESLTDPKKRSSMLEACDVLRDVLREHGLQVVDMVQSKVL